VDPSTVETNIVNVRLLEAKAESVAQNGRRFGVLVNATGPDQLRVVTHLDVPLDRAEEAASRLASAIESVASDEARR
jgi:threonine aldolase